MYRHLITAMLAFATIAASAQTVIEGTVADAQVRWFVAGFFHFNVCPNE